MKILKRIGLFAVAILLAVGAIFVPKTSNSASADNSTSGYTQFNSSDIIFCNTPWNTKGTYTWNQLAGVQNTHFNQPRYAILSYSFLLNFSPVNSSYGNFSYGIKGDYDSDNHLGSINTSPSYNNDGYSGLTFVLDSSSSVAEWRKTIALVYNYKMFIGATEFTTILGFGIDYRFATADFPSLDMVSVEIGSSSDALSNGFAPLVYTNGDNVAYATFNNCNIVTYTDTNGFKFHFYIPCWTSTDSSNASTFYYSYRKYYLTSAIDSSNNEFYLQGLNVGKSQGYDSGYSDGYTNGLDVGYDSGYSEGYNEGVLEYNSYSFFSLVTAVIDAPIRILSSLFNFNLLGVNLWYFITALLTISLVVFVIRKFMGKG